MKMHKIFMFLALAVASLGANICFAQEDTNMCDTIKLVESELQKDFVQSISDRKNILEIYNQLEKAKNNFKSDRDNQIFELSAGIFLTVASAYGATRETKLSLPLVIEFLGITLGTAGVAMSALDLGESYANYDKLKTALETNLKSLKAKEALLTENLAKVANNKKAFNCDQLAEVKLSRTDAETFSKQLIAKPIKTQSTIKIFTAQSI